MVISLYGLVVDHQPKSYVRKPIRNKEKFSSQNTTMARYTPNTLNIHSHRNSSILTYRLNNNHIEKLLNFWTLRIVPCWRYLLGITDSATQSFTLPLFPTSMVGITIALSQPVLTLTALTMALPCQFSDCHWRTVELSTPFLFGGQLITS
jgi:hypothetical protein